MKTLVEKEIRLLLPVYGLALPLAIVPVWLLPKHLASTFNVFSLYPFCLGWCFWRWLRLDGNSA